MKLSSVFLSACLLTSAITPGVLAPPAFASSGGEKEKASIKTIDMPGLVLPVEQDGKLVNYLFVSIVVTISQGYDHWGVRESAHVYRDLILKAAHRKTVGLEGQPMKLDVEAFDVLVREVFDSQLGPESVESVEIVTVDSQKVFLGG